MILFKTIERYTMYMRKVSKAGFIFVNELTIANRIIRDKTIWKDFFELHMNLIHTDNPVSYYSLIFNLLVYYYS